MAGIQCVHCGKEHDERTKFCPNTGKAFSVAALSAPPAAKLPATPVAPGRPGAPPIDINATLPDGIPAFSAAELEAAASDAPGRATRMMFVPKEFAAKPGAPPADKAPSPEPPKLTRPTAGQPTAPAGKPPPGRPTPASKPAAPPAGTDPALMKTQLGGPAPPPPAGAPLPGAEKAPAFLKTQIGGIAPLPPGTTPAAGKTAPPTGAAAKRTMVAHGLPELPAAGPQRATAAGTLTATTRTTGATTAVGAPPDLSEPLPAEAATIVSPALFPSSPGAPPPVRNTPDAALAATVPQSSTTKLPSTIRASASKSAAGRSMASEPRLKSAPAWAVSPDDGVEGAEDGHSETAQTSPFLAALKGFGRLLQRTGTFYVDNLPGLLLLAAVVLGPVSLLTSLLMAGLGGSLHLPFAAALVLGFLVSLLMMGTAWPIATGAIAMAVLDRAHGGKIEPFRYLRFAGNRIGPLITALVPTAFITAIGYFIFFVPGLVASLFLAFVPIAVLLEGRQGADALKRSVLLMKDGLGSALGVFALFVVLAWLVRKGVTALLPSYFLDLLGSDLAMILIAPLPITALAFIYLDLRRSGEGLTTEALRAELDGHAGE